MVASTCVNCKVPVLSRTSARELCNATDVCCTRTLLDTDGFGCADSGRIEQLQRVQIVQLGFGSKVRTACAIPVIVDPA